MKYRVLIAQRGIGNIQYSYFTVEETDAKRGQGAWSQVETVVEIMF